MTYLKVLIVDDSQTVRDSVREVLTSVGITVIEAADGEEGRQLINHTHDLSLVLCDVNMPQMDGLSMLEKIKSDPEHAGLPILMLTTDGDPDLVRRARDAGASGWIVKPFQAHLLLAAVRRVGLSGGLRAAK